MHQAGHRMKQDTRETVLYDIILQTGLLAPKRNSEVPL